MAASQRITLPARSAEASRRPSGLNAVARIQSVCLPRSWSFAPVSSDQRRTTFCGPPSATSRWSGLMSAASTTSSSSPSVRMRRPFFRFQTATFPLWAPTPPPAITRPPPALNRTTCGRPSGKGSTPTRSSALVRWSRICFWPQTATSGAHGLVASAAQASSFPVCTAGSSGRWAGSGGTAGRSVAGATIATSTFFGATATLPLVSSTPPSIQAFSTCRSASGIGGASGGIVGSSSWLTTRKRWLAEASPGVITSPEPPPRMMAA